LADLTRRFLAKRSKHGCGKMEGTQLKAAKREFEGANREN
jgi:hypothetical protein